MGSNVMNKKVARLRRAKRTRMQIRTLKVPRLCVRRSLKHVYAQLTTSTGSQVLAQASTLDKEVQAAGAEGCNINSAIIVGKFIAQRSLAAGIKKIAFDRSGYKYHGRVKALANAAREGGLEF
jgi:large subunit ribosomal protein L18